MLLCKTKKNLTRQVRQQKDFYVYRNETCYLIFDMTFRNMSKFQKKYFVCVCVYLKKPTFCQITKTLFNFCKTNHTKICDKYLKRLNLAPSGILLMRVGNNVI